MFKKKKKENEDMNNDMNFKKKKGIFSKIGKILSSIILGILIFFGVILVIIFIMGKLAQQKGEYAPISLYTIISPSMTPNIAVYDVVVVKKTNPVKIKVGDVISFYSVNDFFDNTPITHRVVEVLNPTNGGLQFRTKGDANSVVDNETALASNVIGKVLFKIPQLGRAQFFLASKGGWLIAILIPALAVIAYDIVKLFKLIRVKKKMEYIRNANSEDVNNKPAEPIQNNVSMTNPIINNGQVNENINVQNEVVNDVNNSNIIVNNEHEQIWTEEASENVNNEIKYEKFENDSVLDNAVGEEENKDEFEDMYKRFNEDDRHEPLTEEKVLEHNYDEYEEERETKEVNGNVNNEIKDELLENDSVLVNDVDEDNNKDEFEDLYKRFNEDDRDEPLTRENVYEHNYNEYKEDYETEDKYNNEQDVQEDVKYHSLNSMFEDNNEDDNSLSSMFGEDIKFKDDEEE